MFERWKRLFRRTPRTIRTIDDLAAAISAGETTPVMRRDGDIQTADLFAGTNLSILERKKVMLRSCGYPAGIRMYVHRRCADIYLERLPPKGQTTFEPHTEHWLPADLIGRYRDVTHCDECGQEFQAADDGYVAYWVVSLADLSLLEEVQREPASQPRTEPDERVYRENSDSPASPNRKRGLFDC